MLFAHVFQPGAFPDILVAFDNPGGEGLLTDLERIGVHLEEAELALHEDEGEGLEWLVRSEPSELAAPPVDAGHEMSSVFLTHYAVDAVGGDD